MRCLVVEDDGPIREDLQRILTAAGFSVDAVGDGETAWYQGDVEDYDAVILDLGLPRLDGLSVLRRWRAAGRAFPVIVVSARADWTEKVEGIEAGADDYLAKPFQMGELVARVRGVMRRSAGRTSSVVGIGKLRLDTLRMTATFDGAPARISPLEFRLLDYLAHQAGRAVPAGELAEHLYGAAESADANAIEAIVARLRRKFGSEIVATRRGFGYLLASGAIGRSLQWRLLLGAAVAILAALAVAWAFMTVLFERHLDRRLEVELTRDALVLVAALSLDAQGAPQVDPAPSDARLQTPAGGFYWQASNARGAARSRSLWDADLPVAADVPRNGWRLRRADGPYDEPVAVLERELVLGDAAQPVTVQLAQDTQPLRTASAEFARELAAFLAVLWLVLSGAAWLQVSLGLRPLRRVRADVEALREHAGARVPAAHLREIQPLTDAINSLAEARERELAQARRRAADLAHGLKTPLAALAAQSRRAREAGAEAAALGMEQALGAIGATVEAELARVRVAAAEQRASAAVRDVVERLVTVLEHTDAGSRVVFDVEVAPELLAPLSPDALSEIVGALLENAARHARRRVGVRATRTSLDSPEVEIVIEDDGPGIATHRVDDALMRGARLDEAGAGTGLGLSIARDLVAATHGTLALGASPLGGLAVRLAWPLSRSASPA